MLDLEMENMMMNDHNSISLSCKMQIQNINIKRYNMYVYLSRVFLI